MTQRVVGIEHLAGARLMSGRTIFTAPLRLDCGMSLGSWCGITLTLPAANRLLQMAWSGTASFPPSTLRVIRSVEASSKRRYRVWLTGAPSIMIAARTSMGFSIRLSAQSSRTVRSWYCAIFSQLMAVAGFRFGFRLSSVTIWTAGSMGRSRVAATPFRVSNLIDLDGVLPTTFSMLIRRLSAAKLCGHRSAGAQMTWSIFIA